jgi:hypothetical protein
MSPQIGQRATLNGKPVIWSGSNYGYQSPATHNKLKNSGKLRIGAQAIDRVVSSLQGLQSQVRKATDNIPGIKQLERLAVNGLSASNSLPSSRVGQGANAVSNKVAEYLNVDPRLLTLGMVAVPGVLGKSVKGVGSKPGITLEAVGPKPKFSGQTPKPAKANLPAPKPVGPTNLDNLPADVSREAFGPGSRQFGAYPRDVAEQRAFSEGMQPVPGGTGTAGRPSAKNSSPALRELATGVRKQTGQQRIRDRLNQGRQGEQPPRGSKPPTSKPLPKLTQEQRVEVQRLKEAREKLDSLQAGSKLQAATRQSPSAYTDLNKPSLGEKSTKAIERRLSDPRENPAPIRKDAQGNIIQPPKPERNKPSSRQDAIKPRPDGYRGYQGRGATNANSNRSGVVKQPTSPSLGRHFQGDGELSGIKQERPANQGRSKSSQNQTLKTLKAMMDRAILNDNIDKVRSIKALIKRLGK